MDSAHEKSTEEEPERINKTEDMKKYQKEYYQSRKEKLNRRAKKRYHREDAAKERARLRYQMKAHPERSLEEIQMLYWTKQYNMLQKKLAKEKDVA